MDQESSKVETAPVQQPEVDETTEVAASSEPVAETTSEAESATDKPKQDPWKTAFIVLVGVVMLSAVLIYSSSSRRTEPATVLQSDANGQPVQPLNPASGVEEERLAALPPDAIATNSNLATQPGQLPGGDGYDPWANGGKPPGGAPIGPGGGYMTVPNGGSQFMPPDCILQPSGIYLCPVPTNANAATKPTPTPKGTPQNANTQPSPTPATGVSPKPTPSPGGVKPSPTPRTRATPAKPSTTKSPELD